MTQRQYQGVWPKFRLLILARDNYTCQLRLKGCKGRATQVDHIIGIAQAPERRLDPTNCQASCKSCNVAKGNRDNPRTPVWRRTPTPSRQW